MTASPAPTTSGFHARAASRRAGAPAWITMRAPAAAPGARPRRLFLHGDGLLALRRVLGDQLSLLGAELLDQVVVRRGLDDLVELRPVVRDQTHAFDVDVVHEPPIALLREPVVDGHLGPALGDDPRRHAGRVAVQPLVAILDLLAAVQLDLRDVRPLEQVAEQRDELRAL